MGDLKRLIGVKGEHGMRGPAGITNFKSFHGWTEKSVQLQDLCFHIVKFLEENPELADIVTITKDSITADFQSNATEKLDMVICHMSDCILELDNRSADREMPEMARALAELMNVRTEAVSVDTVVPAISTISTASPK